jgi:hypothetical protein
MIYFYEDEKRTDIDYDLMIFYYDEEYIDPIWGIKRSRRYMDYGVTSNGKLVILPNEQINCEKQGLIFDSEIGCYFTKKKV